MSVKDDILRGKPKKTATAAPAQQPQAEQVVKQQTQPVVTASTTQALDQGMKGSVAPATATPGLAKRSNREIIDEIARRTTGYEEPTAEELQKEKKRKAIQQLILSLGDGISAISDMHTAVKYAPYQEKDPKTSLSAANQARWDKFYADREARRQRYQTQFDKLWAEHKADEATAYQRERDRLADERAARAEARAAAQFAWQKENAEKTRAHADAAREDSQEFQAEQGAKTRASSERISGQRADAAAQKATQAAADKVRGKVLPFAAPNGEAIHIYGNVWNDEMESVYDILINEGVGKRQGMPIESYKKSMREKSRAEKDTFVKQHYSQSPNAINRMRVLASYDPAKRIFEENNDPYAAYAGHEVGNDSDVDSYFREK